MKVCDDTARHAELGSPGLPAGLRRRGPRQAAASDWRRCPNRVPVVRDLEDDMVTISCFLAGTREKMALFPVADPTDADAGAHPRRFTATNRLQRETWSLISRLRDSNCEADEGNVHTFESPFRLLLRALLYPPLLRVQELESPVKGIFRLSRQHGNRAMRPPPRTC